MRPKKQGSRVLGPYLERNGKWRIIVVFDGKRISKSYCSKDKAIKGGPRLASGFDRPLGPAVTQYLLTLQDRGLSSTTVEAEGRLLMHLFAGDTLSDWPPKRAVVQLQNWQSVHSVATCRLYLFRVRRFWQWLLSVHTATNPWNGLVVVGKVNRGKPQLRVDEARKLCEQSMRRYGEGNSLAAAFPVLLSLGLRAGEILSRQVRDVDDDGGLLWISSGKTANARRTLDVPPQLRPLLRELVANKSPEAPLLGYSRKGKAWTRSQLHALLVRLCGQAGVPTVCPHSLRGLWASLSVRSGVATAAVAAAMGHSSFAVTAKHYAAPGSLDHSRSAVAASYFPVNLP